MKSPRKVAGAARSAKVHNLVDSALKKTFIEMADYWKTLDDRANSAAAKRRQYQAEIKAAGYSMMQVKIRFLLQTPEGEAEFKAEMANRLLAAAYSDADIGDQLSLFLEPGRTPAVDRAFKEGQSAAMKNEAAVPKYDPRTEQYREFMNGYHDEQGRQVKAGIGKLDAKGAKSGAESSKSGAKGAKKAPGRRGRPPGKKADGGATAGSERTLIKKADKDAKAAARAPKPSAGPPRKPVAEPVTRASLAAAKAAAKEDADSYFTRAETKGNA